MKILDSLRETSGPTVAVEVAAHQVSAASMEYRSGTALVGTHATEPLPPGALVPSLTTNNIHNQPAVLDAIKRVLERTEGNQSRAAQILGIHRNTLSRKIDEYKLGNRNHRSRRTP